MREARPTSGQTAGIDPYRKLRVVPCPTAKGCNRRRKASGYQPLDELLVITPGDAAAFATQRVFCYNRVSPRVNEVHG
jgi:hypothetical protein